MATDDERVALIALNTIPWLGPVAIHRLLDMFGSAVNVFDGHVEAIRSIKDISPKVAAIITTADPEALARKEIGYAKKLNAHILTLVDDDYPHNLTSIYAPPPVLSITGELRADDLNAVAVVGTRKATTYGKVMTEKLCHGLVKAGLTVVSGLARGIDGVAHRATLKKGGRTIAVLGNGLNIYYPSEHRELQKSVAERGAVVSQFPFTRSPDKTSFPLRNRVIVGLSLGTVVIEAAKKSGALITAYAALNENREVFALPGQANALSSEGTNLLIQKGHAKLITRVNDILEELPASLYLRSEGAEPVPAVEEQLTFEEETIYSTLDHEPKHIDVIADFSGLPTPMVSAILLALELKERVKQEPGKLFVRI